MSSFAENLKQKMDEKKWSNGFLATKVGCDQNTVSNWRRGTAEPGKKNIRTLCKVLGCTEEWLFGRAVETEAAETKEKDGYGQRLKELIAANGMTAAGVSEKLGLSRTSVQRWCGEHDPIPAKRVPQLCEILGCTPEYLLNGEVVVEEKVETAKNEEKQVAEIVEALEATAIASKMMGNGITEMNLDDLVRNEENQFKRGEIYERKNQKGVETLILVVSAYERREDRFVSMLNLVTTPEGRYSVPIFANGRKYYTDCGMVSYSAADRIGKYFCRASDYDMQGVDDALMAALGLGSSQMEYRAGDDALKEQLSAAMSEAELRGNLLNKAEEKIKALQSEAEYLHKKVKEAEDVAAEKEKLGLELQAKYIHANNEKVAMRQQVEELKQQLATEKERFGKAAVMCDTLETKAQAAADLELRKENIKLAFERDFYKEKFDQMLEKLVG